MADVKIPHRPKVGHTKCFRCRQVRPSREGGWHDHGHGQIFLCKECEKQPLAPRKGGS